MLPARIKTAARVFMGLCGKSLLLLLLGNDEWEQSISLIEVVCWRSTAGVAFQSLIRKVLSSLVYVGGQSTALSASTRHSSSCIVCFY